MTIQTADAPPTPTDSELELRIALHRPHLERVSRSFAFGISRLERRLRANVGLAYLICRMLDTVEDSKWESASSQDAAYDHFEKTLLAKRLSEPETDLGLEASAREWAQAFPHLIAPGERELLNDAPAIFSEFLKLPAADYDALVSPVITMSRGMREYSHRSHAANGAAHELRLHTLGDVNTYCFFVAGVVGELLTSLLILEPEWTDRSAANAMLELGLDFGLFLQKMNVLKDQWGDEAELRFLVPDRTELLISTQCHAQRAFEYLEAIPIARRDYRLFCAWSLMLGLATVPLIRSSKATDDAPKLGKLKALALIARIEFAINDPVKLRALFDELVAEAYRGLEVTLHNGSIGKQNSALVERCYEGQLDPRRLIELLGYGISNSLP